MVEFCASRELNSGRDRLGAGCDEWPLENPLVVNGLPSSHIFPVGGVWWLSGNGGVICNGDETMRIREEWTVDRSGLTSSNAFPDIYAFPLLIPDTAL